MRADSLRLRLGITGAALISLALLLAGFGLTIIFDRVLDARTADELDRSAKLIAGRVGLASDGAPTLSREPPDPRFATPYGGLYWQVETPDRRSLRSRSLWDKRLESSGLGTGDAPMVTDATGPDGGRLLSLSRPVEIDGAGGTATRLRVTVAEDRRGLAASRSTFLRLLMPSLAALFVVLTLAMAVFVHRALTPFRTLRASLAAVHAGTRERLPDVFPDEVRPLVADLNSLLDAQERALKRAEAGAADMAHGLKTPLAVIDALMRRLSTTEPLVAQQIAEQTQAMGGQVDRTLARARLAGARDLRRRSCGVAAVVDRLVATMRRLPEGDSLVWDVSVPADLSYPGDEGELMEVLGNLLDNARKWAHRRVRVTGTPDGAGGRLSVSDDGPGMDPPALAGLGRGVRWDESRPGTGFGLAIARDVAEAAGARMAFGEAAEGGLMVEMVWFSG
ncbi:HAMP domain-containing histidine kinase [Methylobacterium sp. E-025]|uniref:sensor histidine kinase n=1 Tax=Methylobacterium sp. E-025 TaxID=2836561 RepID=UPI001FBA9F47|nr:HAMP domain-containing sensor histidine kinase [Methylobacterium sp. E-025]MCJ2113511.1 HAMP domain-containing histidine kinase [Methylobacterium sp. E-025]